MDRSEIERYRSGLMNESERHALEKRALSDPFLADALEGAERVSAEAFSEDVRDLSVKVSRSNSIRWFTPVRMAAGIVILIASGSLIYFFTKQEPVQLAMEKTVETPAKPDSSTDSSSALLSMEKPEQPVSASGPSKQGKKPSNIDSKADQQPAQIDAQAAAGAGEPQQPKATDTRGDALVAKTEAAEAEIEESKKDVVREETRRLAAAPAGANQKARANIPNRKIEGRVISAEDNSPLSGVNVIVKGSNQGTVTDALGGFTINTPVQNAQLDLHSIGYSSKEVNTVDQTFLNLKMESASSQVTEIDVLRTKDPSAGEVFELASPATGRVAFQDYLKTNLRYPGQAIARKTEGKVTVQFTVTPEGRLKDFTIIKGIGDGCDEELIRLIQNGPAWTPSRLNQSAIEVQVRVLFQFSLPR